MAGKSAFPWHTAFEGWEKLSAEERIQRMIDGVDADDERFDLPLFHPSPSSSSTTTNPPPPLTLISTTTPTPTTATATFRYAVPHAFTNRLGNLHGGAAATIYDILTTLALAPLSKPGFWITGGVSRRLSVAYLRPVPEGEVVRVFCEVVHAGKTLAALRGVMVRERDGAVLSTCEHDKVHTEPPAKAKL